MEMYHGTLTDLIKSTKHTLYKEDYLKYSLYFVCAQYADFLEEEFLNCSAYDLFKGCNFETDEGHKPDITTWKLFLRDKYVVEWMNYENELKLQLGRNKLAKQLEIGNFDNAQQVQAAKFLQELSKYQTNSSQNQQQFIVMFMPPLTGPIPNGKDQGQEEVDWEDIHDD